MAISPQFLDELRARTPLFAVIGRGVRLARSGRQWKGCCQFHGEKTPSFYVYRADHSSLLPAANCVHGDADQRLSCRNLCRRRVPGGGRATRRRSGDAGARLLSGSCGGGKAAAGSRRRAGRRCSELPAPAVPARGERRHATTSPNAACPTTRSTVTAWAGPARAGAWSPPTWHETA